ncbi:MAG: triosephosphate isomerase [Rhodothermales bacterium]|jgi:triosephosphate isomerase
MARTLIIAGNWKLNHDQAATRSMIDALKPAVADVDNIDIVLCPTFTSLATALDAAAGSNVAIGAQNLHWAADGAYTGEISASMLQELGVAYVIIGHSERRQYFAETDATVNQRLNAALAANLAPIVCVGETLEQRESGNTHSVVGGQLDGSLAGIDADSMAKVTLAYEPVWAIGTGVTASPEQAQDVHAFIRGWLRENYGELAGQIRIQYGGSVKPGNAAELMGQEDIDGALVGGASLKAEDFSGIIQNSL